MVPSLLVCAARPQHPHLHHHLIAQVFVQCATILNRSGCEPLDQIGSKRLI
jgi:hypothetical protein